MAEIRSRIREITEFPPRYSWRYLKKLDSSAAKSWLIPFVELSLIAFWVILLGREYLSMNPMAVPAGREFLSAIQTHHLWNDLQACGGCAFWNGYQRGGYPAFVDPHGSMLHPLVAVTTLLWGVINGSKIALLVSLWVAGFAMWWTARVLRLGTVPRIWASLLVVAGGHLAGRMELGVFGVLLSTAMISLVIPPLLQFARDGSRRTAVLLGLTMSSAILAGQGYMQFGMLIVAPATVFLFLSRSLRLRVKWQHLLLSGLVAFLVAAPLLVPFGHFMPEFGKERDTEFRVTQPVEYVPLNLVISDRDFYSSESLDKEPLPHLYMMYIGWVPVLLAAYGVGVAKGWDRRWVFFSLTSILLLLLAASGDLLRVGVEYLEFLGGIRHPPQIAGLIVPLLVTLSAFGLDRLLKRPWPELRLSHDDWPDTGSIRLSLAWILLIPLVLSLRSTYDFSQNWLYVEQVRRETYQLLERMRTEDLQWVSPPFGEHSYIEPGVSMGLKMSPGLMTWYWEGREFPEPVLEANRAGPPPNALRIVDEVDGIPIYHTDALPYAFVDHGDEISQCFAGGRGGHLWVRCSTDLPGELVVQENSWSGWKVWVDGQRRSLKSGQRLRLDAPSGEHSYVLQYRPWDVPLGLGLFVTGLLLSAWFLVPSSQEGAITQEKVPTPTDPTEKPVDP